MIRAPVWKGELGGTLVLQQHRGASAGRGGGREVGAAAVRGRSEVTRLDIDLDEDILKRLHHFQRVIHEILDEELAFDVYVQLVLIQGLEKMLGDVVTLDSEVLWATVKRMAEDNPEFIYDFVADSLRRGAEATQKEEAKRRLGFIKE